MEDSTLFDQDCSASIENMLLAVEALELGACWHGLYPIKEVYM